MTPAPRDAGGDRTSRADGLDAALSVFVLLMFSQPAFMIQFETQTPDAAKFVYLPAYAAGLALLARRWRFALRGALLNPGLVCVVAIAGLSTLWSVSPDETGRRSLALALTTLSGLALGSRWSWSGLARVVAASFAILAVVSLGLGLFAPDVGRMATLFPGAWRGVWLEKNTFGGMMGLGALALLAAARLDARLARLWITFAALSVVLLLLSTSKTALGAFGAGLAAYGFCLIASRGRIEAVAATWLAIALAVCAAGAALLFPDVILAMLGKDASLTGRTRIWAAVGRLVSARPDLGYGYGAVWTDTGPWTPLQAVVREAGFRPEHAHNGWLEAEVEMGVFGLVATAAAFAAPALRGLRAAYVRRSALLILPYVVVIGVMSLTEAVLDTYNDCRWVLLVALAARIVLPEFEIARSRAQARPAASVWSLNPRA